MPGFIIQHNLAFSLLFFVLFQQNKRKSLGESPNVTY